MSEEEIFNCMCCKGEDKKSRHQKQFVCSDCVQKYLGMMGNPDELVELYDIANASGDDSAARGLKCFITKDLRG